MIGFFSPLSNRYKKKVPTLGAFRVFLCVRDDWHGNIFAKQTWNTGWWFQILYFFLFHPYLGKWSNLTNTFEMGWNHLRIVPAFPSVVGTAKRRPIENCGKICLWHRTTIQHRHLVILRTKCTVILILLFLFFSAIQSWFLMELHWIHFGDLTKTHFFVQKRTGLTCCQQHCHIWLQVLSRNIQSIDLWLRLVSQQGELPAQYLEFVILACQGDAKRNDSTSDCCLRKGCSTVGVPKAE